MDIGKFSLPSFAVKRPVTIIMVFLSALIVGMIAWREIQIQLLPDGLDPPFLWLWLSYNNSSPVENLERLTVPVENELSTIQGVKSIYSRSRANGSSIFIEFSQAANMDVAYQAIRDRLERARPEMPDDFRYAYIRRYSENDEPVIYFGVSIVGSYDDPYRLVEERMVKKLGNVDGVASVEMWGGNAKEIKIEFHLAKLKLHNIDIASVMMVLQQSNFVLAGGKLEDGGSELLIRSDSRITDIEGFRVLPIRGNHLILSDLADVYFAPPIRNWTQRIGGLEAIEIGVKQESDANTVELCKKLRKVVDDFGLDPALKGFKMDVFFDQGAFISESVDNLTETGIWGGFFAMMVLFVFLRRLRMTLFITFAIPVSLLITVTCLYFMNWTLNVITLSGLMICVGLVVDNAIVVVENIYTHRQMGASRRIAAVKGAGEVSLAITLATLTTVVVFLPLLLMSGDRMMAFYLLRIGLPVVFALLASLMVALLFIPLAVNKFAMGGAMKQNRYIDAGAQKIGRLVSFVLNHRVDTFVILMLLLITGAFPMSKVVSTDEEGGHINDFRLRFSFPSYYSLDKIDSTLTSYESLIYENKEKYDIKTVVTGFRRGYGRLRIYLNKSEKQSWYMTGLHGIGRKTGLLKSDILSRKEVIDELKEKIIVPPDVELFTSWHRSKSEEDVVYVTIYGENIDRLGLIAGNVKATLETVPEIVSVELDLDPVNDEIQIIYNRSLTTKFGVDAAASSRGITSMIRGVDLPVINIEGHEINTRVELKESDRASLEQVMNLPLNGSATMPVRLGDVADVVYEKGLGEITRENGRIRIRLKITSDEEDLDHLSGVISEVMSRVNLPPGYDWGKGRRFQSVEDASKERSQAWILALMFVFLLMGALFESFILPWVVIVTIPFSFFGVWWIMFLTGTQFGVMAGVGVVILIGVVVNNAIVLIDYARRLIHQGMERNEALIQAAHHRFRPIAMTALTTIMGLIPMAVGNANMIGIPYAPMGRAIIGGMLAATISTPIVVPLVYTLVDDFQIWAHSYLKSINSKNNLELP